MARADISELEGELAESEFRFVGSGEKHLHDVYEAVQAKHADLCDDSHLCKDNCSDGHDQPEWKHAVRRTLDRLKNKSQFVASNDRRSYWNFGNAA